MWLFERIDVHGERVEIPRAHRLYETLRHRTDVPRV